MTKIAASQRQEVVDLCIAGKSKDEVATAYGVTSACISLIVRNLGVVLPPKVRVRQSAANDGKHMAIIDLYKSGKTQAHVAAAFGLSTGRVCQILKFRGIGKNDVPRSLIGKEGAYRRTVPMEDYPALIEMYKSGKSLEQVGAVYGVSRERIRQILTALGVTRMDGGKTMSQLSKVSDRVAAVRARNERREAYWRGIWGMGLADYHAFVAEHGSSENPSSPLRKYIQHRNNAKKRGIAWNFTFPEWWGVWQESGKWDQRALTKHGYVMARWGDGDAPYSVDTVYICTSSQNVKDGYIVSPSADRVAKARITRATKATRSNP